MANLERIVKVDVSLNTAGISSEGFSTMMVVGPHGYTTERVISVTDADDLIGLGFKSTDPIYIAVSDAMSQIPRPREVKVGRFQCDAVRLKLETDDIIEGKEYIVTISTIDAKGNLVSDSYSYVTSMVENKESLLQSIADSVKDATYVVSVVEDEIIIRSAEPSRSFKVEAKGLEISSFDMADKTVAENMALIASADNDFYGLVYVSRKQEDIVAMADWCEANKKLYGTAIDEPGAKNSEVTTDTGSVLQNGNYFRTYWFYHEDAANDYPESGVMGRCFAVMPGGETWANKQLAGIKTNRMAEHEYQAVTKKNGNTFEAFRNIAITQNGKVAAGEWIDVIRFRDWLEETIKTEIFSMLINRDKLPFTDTGIAMVENVLNQVLRLGQDRGGIAPTEYDEDGNKNLGYTITVPKASRISANVKAQRVLRDIKFTARLAGAIHVIEITGNVTYENLIVA